MSWNYSKIIQIAKRPQRPAFMHAGEQINRSMLANCSFPDPICLCSLSRFDIQLEEAFVKEAMARLWNVFPCISFVFAAFLGIVAKLLKIHL